MDVVEIQVEKRNEFGKGPARRARASGKVPGVLYGPNIETPVALSTDEKALEKAMAHVEGAQLIQLESDAGDLARKLVLLREMQSHPVTGRPLHVDFLEVDLKEQIEVEVALHFEGDPPGVETGGILQPIRREITVRCLPMAIPDFLPIDVSGLEIHDVIHVADLRLPEGVEAIYDENFTIVTVSPPSVELEREPAEEEEPAVAGEEKPAPDEGTEEKSEED